MTETRDSKQPHALLPPAVVRSRSGSIGWRLRMALAIVLVVATATVWITNNLLTSRFTETTRNRAELRLALYGGNLLSELRRNAIVPQLLARDDIGLVFAVSRRATTSPALDTLFTEHARRLVRLEIGRAHV